MTAEGGAPEEAKATVLWLRGVSLDLNPDPPLASCLTLGKASVSLSVKLGIRTFFRVVSVL